MFWAFLHTPCALMALYYVIFKFLTSVVVLISLPECDIMLIGINSYMTFWSRSLLSSSSVSSWTSYMLNIEAANSSEISATVYESGWHYTPEEFNLQLSNYFISWLFFSVLLSWTLYFYVNVLKFYYCHFLLVLFCPLH